MTMWERGPAPEAASKEAKASPDGKWEAFIRNYNVCLRDKAKKEEFVLSRDGSEGNYYTFESIAWSPDSKKLAADPPAPRLSPRHPVRRVLAGRPAPAEVSHDGIRQAGRRPRHRAAGALSRSTRRARIEVDNALFPNPYELSRPRSGGRTAGPSPSNTTSAATRSTGSSRSTPTTGTARAAHRRGAEDLLLPTRGKKYRYDVADGQRDHLDVGARRLEPSLPLRRRDRRGEEPDHQGRVGRPRRRQGRRGDAPDLVPGRAA